MLRERHKKILAILILSSVVALTQPPTSSAAPSGPSVPFSLTVSVIPPRLPADGKVYPAVVVAVVDKAGQPSLALEDTVVYLASSLQNVGSTDSSVTIPAGRGYSVANFTTTTTPGTTFLTASSTGLQSASAAVPTATPSGFPTSLRVFSFPDTVFVKPKGVGSLVVEVQDDTGAPAKAVRDTNVSLSSSNRIVDLPQKSVLIHSGDVVSIADYSTTFRAGSAFITATASGFNSGFASVSVVGATPLALRLYAQPDSIVTSSAGRLVLSLTDLSGSPARAPADIPVRITSSNLTVATVEQTAIIPSGEIYTTTTYSSTAAKGVTNVTISSPGLRSAFAQIHTNKPSTAVSLKIFAAPNPVFADDRFYRSVLVSLLDAGGFPATSSQSISVTLTSSNSAVGSVNGSLTINAGSSFAVTSFKSTFLVGATTITASAQNLLSALATVSTSGPVPAKVVARAQPETLPADGGIYPALGVMLQDASGKPAVAPMDVIVELSSSRTDIASVNSSVIIRAGETFVSTGIKTAVAPGMSNVTAFASGYNSSSTLIKTVSPEPSKLSVYLSPSTTINSPSGNEALLAVQLQGTDGSPARARQDTDVIVTSSNQTLMNHSMMLRIRVGADYVGSFFTAMGSGNGTLTASAPGFSSSNTQVFVLRFPLTLGINASSRDILTNQTTSLTVSVLFLGAGLKGVNVSWSSTSGTIKPPVSSTDADGRSVATYMPNSAGVSGITATIYHRLIGTANLTSNIFVGSPPAKPRLTPYQRILQIIILPSLPYILILAFVAIVGLVARRIIRRRRRFTAEEEAEKEFETSQESGTDKP